MILKINFYGANAAVVVSVSVVDSVFSVVGFGVDSGSIGLFRIDGDDETSADGCDEEARSADCGGTVGAAAAGATISGAGDATAETGATVEDAAASDSPPEILLGTPAGCTGRDASVVDANGTLEAFESNGNGLCSAGTDAGVGNDG